jgi:hypothetical protein
MNPALAFYAALARRHHRAGRFAAYMTVRMLVRAVYGLGALCWLDNECNREVGNNGLDRT